MSIWILVCSWELIHSMQVFCGLACLFVIRLFQRHLGWNLLIELQSCPMCNLLVEEQVLMLQASWSHQMHFVGVDPKWILCPDGIILTVVIQFWNNLVSKLRLFHTILRSDILLLELLGVATSKSYPLCLYQILVLQHCSIDLLSMLLAGRFGLSWIRW